MISINIEPIKDLKGEDQKYAVLKELTKAQLDLLQIYENMLNPSEEVDNNEILNDGRTLIETYKED